MLTWLYQLHLRIKTLIVFCVWRTELAAVPLPALPSGDGRRTAEWTGATEEWADEIRLSREELAATRDRDLARVDGEARWLGPTGEHALVSLVKGASAEPEVILPDVIEHDGVLYGAPTMTDELGEWCPLDYELEAARLFQSLAVERMASWGRLVPETERPALVAGLAEKVICGS